MQTFTSYIPILTFVGVIAAGIAVVFFNWKKGGTIASEETLKLREQQVEALKDQVGLFSDQIKKQEDEARAREARFNQEIKELTGKIGELTGLLQAREKENKELREIILNRNPEVEIFYKNAMQYFIESKPVISDMKQFMSDMQKYVEANTKELMTQTQELKHQSEILEQAN